MSSRNMRRVRRDSLPPPDSDSDGEFKPVPDQQKKSTYAGLELSSESEERHESKAEDESDEPKHVPGGARKKVMVKKKKSKGKGIGKKSKKSLECTEEPSSSNNARGKKNKGLDEIDKSVMEVNALLGLPEPAPVKVPPRTPTDLEKMRRIVLAVHARHLNVTHELRRLFGPQGADEIRLRAKTQPHRARILKRVLVGPTHDTPLYDFKKQGLSMSVMRNKRDVIHFAYDHDIDHQKMQQAFFDKLAEVYEQQEMKLINMEEGKKFMHVEPLLQNADVLFRTEEYALGNEIIENVVTYLQFVAHPSFNLTSLDVRLSYTYYENRPFHVAMLKYLYLLSNKACHRTALEIAKMLLNMDPSDPLAILLVIDTLALRAREHEWLIDATVFFSKQRHANMMFNIQHSYALAQFHVARKANQDYFEADKSLQIAIKSYPEVVIMILEFASVKEPRIQSHTLFSSVAVSSRDRMLTELIIIYAKLTCARWREPPVMEWLIKNAIEVTENFNNSEDVRDEVDELATRRHRIFRKLPIEILRHILVIKNMSSLIMEIPLSAGRPASGWDPRLDVGENRYGYVFPNEPSTTLTPGGRTLFYRRLPAACNEYHRAHLALIVGKRAIRYPWKGIYLSDSTLLYRRLHECRLSKFPKEFVQTLSSADETHYTSTDESSSCIEPIFVPSRGRYFEAPKPETYITKNPYQNMAEPRSVAIWRQFTAKRKMKERAERERLARLADNDDNGTSQQ